MPETLPRLRMDLDFMPSPLRDRPGLLIRDPFRYSDATLIVPPVLVQCLQFFDGQQTDIDLRAALVQLTGDLQIGEVEQHLRQALSDAGFVDDGVYRRLRSEQHAAFAQAERRAASHARGPSRERPSSWSTRRRGSTSSSGPWVRSPRSMTTSSSIALPP